jgi:hypothetical protein
MNVSVPKYVKHFSQIYRWMDNLKVYSLFQLEQRLITACRISSGLCYTDIQYIYWSCNSFKTFPIMKIFLCYCTNVKWISALNKDNNNTKIISMWLAGAGWSHHTKYIEYICSSGNLDRRPRETERYRQTDRQTDKREGFVRVFDRSPHRVGRVEGAVGGASGR